MTTLAKPICAEVAASRCFIHSNALTWRESSGRLSPKSGFATTDVAIAIFL